MILPNYRCDRDGCDQEEGPVEEGEMSTFITVLEPCPVHEMHQFHYCSWNCAMHGCGEHLDRVEQHEEETAREED